MSNDAATPSPLTRDDLPSWACVSERRFAHIARVVALLERWASELHLEASEANAWRDAGRWHDALRDAPEEELRELLGDHVTPAALLHGPAAAHRLQLEGERRWDVLDAVAHHTTGALRWSRTGRALYMADFLEPGRSFESVVRRALADRVSQEFDTVFREVVNARIDWAVKEGLTPQAETIALRDSLR